MESTELQILLDNFDDLQLEVVRGVALNIASIKADDWTGKVNLEINAVNGVIKDMHVNRGEIVRFKSGRRIRSSGL